MKPPEKTKTDPLGWIFAFVFPKKGKAIPAQSRQNPPATPTPAETAPGQIAQNTPSASIDSVKPAPTQLMKYSRVESSTPQKPFFETGKVLPAFWTVASVLSFVVNVVLILVLVLLARELFVLKAMVGNKLLGGLYENFIFMDQAHIKTQITVADNIPINFTLPISQDTVVTLTQNTPISGATVRINSGGLAINSLANIVLPAGTTLPVHLELTVPVNTSVPIQINVPVDIPLDQTELHKPFIGLQQVIAPFYQLLQPQIKSSQDMSFCKSFSSFCSVFFPK